MKRLGRRAHGFPPGGEGGWILGKCLWVHRSFLHSCGEASAAGVVSWPVTSSVAKATPSVAVVFTGSGSMAESWELVQRCAVLVLLRAIVDLDARHGMTESRNINFLWQMVQEFAILSFGACAPKPKPA